MLVAPREVLKTPPLTEQPDVEVAKTYPVADDEPPVAESVSVPEYEIEVEFEIETVDCEPLAMLIVVSLLDIAV